MGGTDGRRVIPKPRLMPEYRQRRQEYHFVQSASLFQVTLPSNRQRAQHSTGHDIIQCCTMILGQA